MRMTWLHCIGGVAAATFSLCSCAARSAREAAPTKVDHGVHQPATGAADGQGAGRGAPWPGWVAVPDPQTRPDDIECAGQLSAPMWGLRRDDGGRVLPVQVGKWAPVVDPLPVELPAELRSSIPADAARRVIDVDDGWLVAVDKGEFGAGLFWVDKTGMRGRRIDSALDERIRWISRVTFGLIGVAGLCHGEACARHTKLYRIDRNERGDWALTPHADVVGCPAARVLDPGADAVLIGTCGALYRVTKAGVDTVGQWSNLLIPRAFEASVTGDAHGDYHVSFGRLIARFSGSGKPDWFAPTSCASVQRDAGGACSCVQ